MPEPEAETATEEDFRESSQKPGTNRGLKILLVSLAAGVLVAGVVFLVVRELQRPWFSPPDQPREWARAKFEEMLLNGAPPGSLPTLSSTPALGIEPTYEEGKVILDIDGTLGIPKEGLHEIFNADKKGEVVLPTGNRLKLSAVGLVMPEDLPEGSEDGGMAEIDWRKADTLDPFPLVNVPEWKSKQWVQGDGPELFLWVSNEGGEPIRWLGVDAFDERTLVQVQSGCSFRTHEKDGEFSMSLETWHQAPLLIAVKFAFGEAETQEIALEPDVEVRFGDDALVRVIAVTPSRITGSGSSSSNSSQVRKEFRFPTSESEIARRNPQRGAIVHLWPPHNEKLIDFVFEKKEGNAPQYGNAWGTDGIGRTDFPVAEELKSLKVRRMPRLGRAVFRLARTPRLPETDNLFETPIKLTKLSYRSRMERTIRKGGGVQYEVSHSNRVPDAHFPMVLEDTTPVEILRLDERLASRPLFFDRKELKVTDERSGMWSDFKDWWRRTKPRLIP